MFCIKYMYLLEYTAPPLNRLSKLKALHLCTTCLKTSSIPYDFHMKTEDIKAALNRSWGGSHCWRETACVWEWVLRFKLKSVLVEQCGLSCSPAGEGSDLFSWWNKSFSSSDSADPASWLSCSFSLISPSTFFSSSSGSLTLCTMKRCLLRDSTDVKHRPQWRHWGVFSSVLCWGICCWNSVLLSVTKPHFEQRNWVFRRLAEGASRLPAGSWTSICVPTSGVADTSLWKSQVMQFRPVSRLEAFMFVLRNNKLLPCPKHFCLLGWAFLAFG